ncbi:phenylacetaldoxime dehydratase family protein [Hyphomicrobium sulfonivorans]|uniref:phenylacetaldoxime dehydratase family protein n=1 Tax=Hyphomicrobium sulfonivorans TaxID=121290 RepID=UPI000AC9457B|nr:phenylacetaldoxime dehydratase family protein [Hyphomicrobium sulfonivorans]
MTLDSSIPEHLRCPRTRHRRVTDTWKPPYPAFSAKVDPTVEQMVMAYLGVQSKDEASNGKACAAFQTIRESLKLPDGPARHDLVQFVDALGCLNLIVVAYWKAPETYAKWNTSSEIAGWWASDDRLNDGVGYFREIFSPRMEQFETIFTHDYGPFEGVSVLFGNMSEPIFEHGYWGSMRDRLPISQNDTIEPSGSLTVVQGQPAAGGRVIISGHQNLTLIRSGEDWRRTEGEERRTWYEEIEPVLHQGMDFLRDDGLEVGCYSNRYCHHIDENGNPEERGFGVSFWNSLAALEHWGESHPTHLQIFVTFMRNVKKFKELTLYHEVSVFDASNQYFEYINCHPKTGLLRAV